MTTMAMFPLGTVLLPYMPLRLRVFEQRYLVMLNDLLTSGVAEFGTVLIERGQEVGGGDHRFGYGTVAEVTGLGAQDGFVGLVAEGRERFEVKGWLPDDPHPRAEVSLLPPLVWDDAAAELLAGAQERVRRTLSLASEFREDLWPADIELSDDPLRACWQLCGIAPLASLDQLRLLKAPTVQVLLTDLIGMVDDQATGLSAPWPDDPSADGEPTS